MLGCSPPALAAPQGLPPYVPISPMIASRSGLYFQPYLDPSAGWHIATSLDYANAIEESRRGSAEYLLDAELLRVDLTLSRDLSPTTFLAATASMAGSYNGFLDPFLNWYHSLIGMRHGVRTARPENQFDFVIQLPDGTRLARHRSGAFLGDGRVAFGVRLSRGWQTVVSVTLPTTTGPPGYGRGVPSLNLLTTVRSALDGRWTYEGSAGVGYSAQSGDLSAYQRTVFGWASSGLRFRFAGRQAAFANVLYQTPDYERTTLPGLDDRTLGMDDGVALRLRRGPEWDFALAELLWPRAAANDPTFRIGARWR